MAKTISNNGVNLIKKYEGCRLTAYKCVSTEQYYTIGWGHYGKDVVKGQTISQAQADQLLLLDLQKYVGYVNNTEYCPVTDKLTQNQFDALVSFTYNCGAGNLKTLCKNRSITEIGNALPLYNKSGGKILAGLIKRRNEEKELFFSTENKTTYAEEKAAAAAWVKSVGISDGSNPTKNITREQMWVMLYRALHK